MLPEINVILYATDLTGKANYACRYAVYLADKTGATVHVVHVAEKLPADAMDTLETYLEKFESREDFQSSRLKMAERLLNENFDHFWSTLDDSEQKLRSLVSTVHIVESKPAEAIIKYSKDINADLIIMGSHKKGPVQAFLGSISRRVLSMASIPTLIVPIGKNS